MRELLNRFITFCEVLNCTPAEDEIDAFLRKSREKDKEIMRIFLIKFCFYYWEKRYNKILVEKILNRGIH